MRTEKPNDDLTFSLLSVRQRLGVPSEEVSISIMQQLYPAIVSKYTSLLTDKDLCLKGLMDSRMLHEKKGEKISRVRNCVSLVLGTVSISSERNAEKFINSEESFKFFFDFSVGSRMPLESMLLAEDELIGEAENSRLEAVSRTGKVMDFSVADESEFYLFLKKEATGAVEMLKKDPTGFLLVDNCAKRIGDFSKSISVNPSMSRKYMFAGAELARDLYKKVYEISAALYPQEKQK